MLVNTLNYYWKEAAFYISAYTCSSIWWVGELISKLVQCSVIITTTVSSERFQMHFFLWPLETQSGVVLQINNFSIWRVGSKRRIHLYIHAVPKYNPKRWCSFKRYMVCWIVCCLDLRMSKLINAWRISKHIRRHQIFIQAMSKAHSFDWDN